MNRTVERRVAIHIVNSTHFFELTGNQPPATPVDSKSYTENGLPWFDIYDEFKEDVAPSDHFTGVKTVAEIDAQSEESTAGNESVDVSETQIKKLDAYNSGQRMSPPPSAAEPDSASKDEENE